VNAIDLGKTQITPLIRVSSAALYREEWFGCYWLIESFIFSEDKKRQQTTQIIHSSQGCARDELPSKKLCDEARKIHGYIAANLMLKFKEEN